MSIVITYSYVNWLLNTINPNNKLTFLQFQEIYIYLYKKVDVSLKLIKKKSFIKRNLNLVSDVMNKLELIIRQNLIAEPEYKDTMLRLLDDLKKEVEKSGVIVC
jgi:hypothetical protein